MGAYPERAVRSRRDSAASRRVQWPIRNDQSILEVDCPRSISSDVALVRNQDDRDSPLRAEAREDLHHLVARGRIEIAGRLVGEQQRRLRHQRAGDRHPLLLSAGQLVGMMFGAIGEAHGLERRHGALAAFRRLDDALAGVEQRQLDVLDRRRARQQVEALKHEADRFVANPGELVGRQRRHVTAVQDVTAARRPVEAAEDVHEGRLARAGRSDDRDELGRGDRHGDAAQGMHHVIADVIFLGEVVNTDHL